jgi:hypothetical protein
VGYGVNTTFNNISVLSRQSVLLVEETGVSGENHWPIASHRQSLSHNVVLTPLAFLMGILKIFACLSPYEDPIRGDIGFCVKNNLSLQIV